MTPRRLRPGGWGRVVLVPVLLAAWTSPPGQRAVVEGPVTAVASGRGEVVSQLVTRDGLVWGPPGPAPGQA